MSSEVNGITLKIKIMPNQYSILGIFLIRAMKRNIKRTLFTLATIAPTRFETCVDSIIIIYLIPKLSDFHVIQEGSFYFTDKTYKIPAERQYPMGCVYK